MSHTVRLFYPLIDEDDARSIAVALDEAWLGLGKHVYEFEQLWEKRFSLEPGHAAATNSATAALHLALLLSDLEPGSEVLVPALTFISSVSTIRQAGHIPVFVDVDEDTLTLSISDLANKVTPKTKAIVAVHYGGEPCDMPSIMKLSQEKNLVVIEDCAHTQGSVYKGVPLGCWGHFGCFSFEEKKGMTTGDGGMIVAKDPSHIARAKHIRWLGIDKDTWQRSSTQTHHGWYYEIHELGYKYNMNNLAARLGISQLSKLDRINSIKRRHITTYLKRLSGIPGLKPLLPYSLISDPSSSYWLFGIRVAERDALMNSLNDNNISYGMHFTPINEQPLFKESISTTPVTSRISEQLITLPLSPGHSDEEINYVCDVISDFFK